MQSNHDGINTNLKALPDDFSHQESIVDSVNHNAVNDTKTRTRSNSGSVFESTSNILRDQQPAMLVSQSYGGDHSSSFLSSRGDLSHVSRLYR